MVVIEYRKVKCDECGKVEEADGGESYPSNWFTIAVHKWFGNMGNGELNKEVCSEKCAIKLMNNLKKIPKRTTSIY